MALPWSRETDVRAVLSNLPRGFINTYVEWVETQTDAPLAYGLGTALGLLASVAPPHLCVQGLPDGDVYPNVYVMLVGRQGIDRKSTAIKYGTRLLEDAVPGRRGDAPGSAEGLIQGLEEKPQQLLVYSDLGSFFSETQMRRGGNYATGIKGRLLPLFDCEPVERRLSRRLVRVEQPRLSILGGVNRSILDSYVDQTDWENGFTSRFVVVYAHRERIRHHRDKQPAVREYLKGFLATMAALAGTEEVWGDCVGLTNEAYRLLRCFTHGIEVTTPDDGSPRSFGPRARVRVMTIKVAHLLGLSAGLGWPIGPQQPGIDWKIDAPTMKAAIRIAMMMFTGALAITATSTGDLDMRQRSRVLYAVKPTWTTLGNVLVNAQILKRRANDVLVSLVAEGTIVQRKHETSGKVEYRRTGANSAALGVQDAMNDAKAILSEYSRAHIYGVPATPGISSIVVPQLPVPVSVSTAPSGNGASSPAPGSTAPGAVGGVPGAGPAPDPFTVDLRDAVASIFGGVRRLDHSGNPVQ